MPYIITTKERHPSQVDSAAPFGRILTRRAVGTLDEARHEAGNKISRPEDGNPEEWDGFVFQAWMLPESGGTIGPLPDGTVIEVEAVGWTTLATGWTVALTDEAAMIDAYNAAQED